MQASVVAAHTFSICGTLALLLLGTWDLPGPGIEPVSPALAGRFLSTVPPGKSVYSIFLLRYLQPDSITSKFRSKHYGTDRERPRNAPLVLA